MTVVPLRREEPRERSLAGEARCLACKHEWAAVAPIPVSELECPQCGMMQGRFKYPVAPRAGDLTWECGCGCEDFYVYRAKDWPEERDSWLVCTYCGQTQSCTVGAGR